MIRPATVVRVINKWYFIVELDDHTKSDEARPGNQLCCHAGSLNIFPVGWCSDNNVHLSPVPGELTGYICYYLLRWGYVVTGVCLFVCQQFHTKTTERFLNVKILPEVYRWKKERIKFWKSSTLGSGSRNFLKDSSAVPDRALFRHSLTRISGGKPIRSSLKFYHRCICGQRSLR